MSSESPHQFTPYSQIKSPSFFESPINLIDYSRPRLQPQQPILRITELQSQEDIGPNDLNSPIRTSQHPEILLFDVCGNQLTPVLSQFECGEKEASDEEKEDLPKENEVPKMATPLKVVRGYPNRSPLLDITPSLTHRKTKKVSQTDHKNKTLFMTPRTMAGSRKFDSSHLKNSRM